MNLTIFLSKFLFQTKKIYPSISTIQLLLFSTCFGIGLDVFPLFLLLCLFFQNFENHLSPAKVGLRQNYISVWDASLLAGPFESFEKINQHSTSFLFGVFPYSVHGDLICDVLVLLLFVNLFRSRRRIGVFLLHTSSLSYEYMFSSNFHSLFKLLSVHYGIGWRGIWKHSQVLFHGHVNGFYSNVFILRVSSR